MSNTLVWSYKLHEIVPSFSMVERNSMSSHSLIDFFDGVLARANDSRMGRSDELGSIRHVDGSPSRPARPISCLCARSDGSVWRE